MGDLKVPLALVLAMAVQLVGGVWWISEQAHKIKHLEDRDSHAQPRRNYALE